MPTAQRVAQRHKPEELPPLAIAIFATFDRSILAIHIAASLVHANRPLRKVSLLAARQELAKLQGVRNQSTAMVTGPQATIALYHTR
ncbi:hypothetical protein V5O48_007801, partial [Marasmius crinis-equi]